MNHLERDKNRTLAVPAASMRIAKEPLTNGRLRPHLGVEGDNPGFASLFGSDVNGAPKEARAAIRSVGAGAVEHHARRAEPLRVTDAAFGVFTGLHPISKIPRSSTCCRSSAGLSQPPSQGPAVGRWPRTDARWAPERDRRHILRARVQAASRPGISEAGRAGRVRPR